MAGCGHAGGQQRRRRRGRCGGLGGLSACGGQPPEDSSDAAAASESAQESTPSSDVEPLQEQAETSSTPTSERAAVTQPRDDASSSPVAASEQSLRPALVVLTPSDAWVPSGDLTPASSKSLTGGEWGLSDPYADWAPRQDGPVTVEYADGTLTVTVCEAQVVVQAEVQDGHLVADGPPATSGETDPAIECGPLPEQKADYWTELLAGSPLIGMDRAGVVIARPSSLSEQVPVSLAFDVVGTDDPATGTLRPATLGDLMQTFDEVPPAAAADLEPLVIDTDPQTTMRFTGGEANLRLVEPCEIRYDEMWVLQTSTESRLIGMRGTNGEDGCEGDIEESTFVELLNSIPTVQIDGPHLVLQGRLDDRLVVSETTAQECSASPLGEQELLAGESTAEAEATARRLLDAALACDTATLIELAEQDQTALSLGYTTPRATFGFPESSFGPYATIVELLSSGPPDLFPNAGDEFGGSVWSEVADGSPQPYILSISPNGTWTGFLALDD